MGILTEAVDFPAGVWGAPLDWDFLTSEEPIILPSGRFPIQFTPWPNGIAGELVIIDGNETIYISPPANPDLSEKWYYQYIYLTDINGDGLTDVLCARNREAKNGY